MNIATMQKGLQGGEISPSLAAQEDSQPYKTGLETLLNAFVLPQGGVRRRSGFKYVATAAGQGTLIPFIFSTGQAYMLLFTDLAVQVYKDGAVLAGATVVTTYTASEVADIRYCQSGDTLFLAHPDHATAILVRSTSDETSWTLTDLQVDKGPFRPENVSGTTLTPSGTTGSITVTAANTSVANGTFATDIDDWTTYTAGTGTAAWDGVGQARLYSNGSGDTGAIYQAITSTPSENMTIEFDLTLSAGTGFYFLAGTSGAGSDIYSEQITTGGSKSVTFFVPSGVTMVYITLLAGENSVTTALVDNVTADAPEIFDDPDHEGSIWKITHPTALDGFSAGFAGTGATNRVLYVLSGEFRVQLTSATWVTNRVNLEKTLDGGVTWLEVKEYSADTDETLTDLTDGVAYRLNCTAYSAAISFTLSSVKSTGTGYVRITAITDAQTATADVVGQLYGTTATAVWAEGSWSDYRGHPEAVCFYENRLMLGPCAGQPTTVWGSRTNDYSNFSTTEALADSESVSFTLLSRQINKLYWLEPSDRLLIGTSAAEWWMSGSRNDEPLSPSSVRARAAGHTGSAAIDTARVGDEILAVQRSGKRLIAILFDQQFQAYTATDISVLADHMAHESAITQIAYQQYPNSVIWCVRADGVLLAVTYDRAAGVVGWSRHTTDGTFEAIACIPNATTGQDDLYAIVNRTIGGGTVRYVEILQPDFYDSTNCEDAFFVDSGASYDGYNTVTDDYLKVTGASYDHGDSVTLSATGHTPFTAGSVDDYYRLRSGTDFVDCLITAYTNTSTVTADLVGDAPTSLQNTDTADWALMTETLSGLTHLNAETVDVVENGGVAAQATVAAGAITLSEPSATCCAGITYNTDIKTLPITGGREDGSSRGRQKVISYVSLVLFQTRGLQMGPDSDSLFSMNFDDIEGDDIPGWPLSVFTGDIGDVFQDNGASVKGQVLIRQAQPLPMTVLGIVTHFEAREK